MSSESVKGFATAFVGIIEQASRKYGTPLPQRLLEVGDQWHGWYFRLNPTGATIDDIEPLSATVYWNGLPAGIIGPEGGILAAGDAVNEQSFIRWLRGSDVAPCILCGDDVETVPDGLTMCEKCAEKEAE